MKHKNFYLAGGLFVATGIYLYYYKKPIIDDVFKSISSKNKQSVTVPPLETEQKTEDLFDDEYISVSKSIISNPSDEIGL